MWFYALWMCVRLCVSLSMLSVCQIACGIIFVHDNFRKNASTYKCLSQQGSWSIDFDVNGTSGFGNIRNLIQLFGLQ
jgi:hypothetical protein